jgi:hypothetical protein
MFNENPYRSPCCTERANGDWTLAKRLLAITAAIAIWYLLMISAAAWKDFKALPLHQDKSPVQTLIEFASDWRSGNH